MQDEPILGEAVQVREVFLSSLPTKNFVGVRAPEGALRDEVIARRELLRESLVFQIKDEHGRCSPLLLCSALGRLLCLQSIVGTRERGNLVMWGRVSGKGGVAWRMRGQASPCFGERAAVEPFCGLPSLLALADRLPVV